MTLHTYGLLSDTHGHVHPMLFEAFAGVEAILHAGDVGGDHVLNDLETIARTYAVQGNVDAPGQHRLPPLRIIELPFGRTVLTHSHLVPDPGNQGTRRLVTHFHSQAPRLVLFGHTHQPLREHYGYLWLVNPGPAGKPRFRDRPQAVRMTWDSEQDDLAFEDIVLDWEAVRL